MQGGFEHFGDDLVVRKGHIATDARLLGAGAQTRRADRRVGQGQEIKIGGQRSGLPFSHHCALGVRRSRFRTAHNSRPTAATGARVENGLLAAVVVHQLHLQSTTGQVAARWRSTAGLFSCGRGRRPRLGVNNTQRARTANM